jgi:hypothetical protein
VIAKRLHGDFAAIAQRLRSDLVAIPCTAFVVIAKRFHGDCETIAQRLRSNLVVISQQFRSDRKAIA